jgi:hypothetical protein
MEAKYAIPAAAAREIAALFANTADLTRKIEELQQEVVKFEDNPGPSNPKTNKPKRAEGKTEIQNGLGSDGPRLSSNLPTSKSKTTGVKTEISGNEMYGGGKHMKLGICQALPRQNFLDSQPKNKKKSLDPKKASFIPIHQKNTPFPSPLSQPIISPPIQLTLSYPRTLCMSVEHGWIKGH